MAARAALQSLPNGPPSLPGDIRRSGARRQLHGSGAAFCNFALGGQQTPGLVRVLAATPPTGLDIYVVYPARNKLPKRVRAFLDHLRDWARSPPDWALVEPAPETT